MPPSVSSPCPGPTAPATLNRDRELAHHWWHTLAVTTAGDTAARATGDHPSAAGALVDHDTALLASVRALTTLGRLARTDPRAELSVAGDHAARTAARPVGDADPDPSARAAVDTHRQGV